MDFLKQFKAARAVGVSLVAIRTPDPANTLRLVTELLGEPEKQPAVLLWDVLQGLRGYNKPGRVEVERLLEGAEGNTVTRPSDALSLGAKLSEDGVFFLSNANAFWNDAVVQQGIWNLRDLYKSKGSMLICMTTAGATLPAVLAEDVLLLDEPLPTLEELARIVESTYAAAGLKQKLTQETINKATDALIGLAAFPAEQAVAMSLSSKGIDLTGLWERKRSIISQTPGLSVWRGGEKFDQIGGVENVKQFMRAIIKGKNAPRVVVFIDEVEKAFAGMGTDTSGVKTEMTGTLLTWMQDHKARGVIFIGPPGCSKSVVAKATGNEADIPTIAFDMSAMQDSLVGKSGQRLRAALKVVEAVSQDRALFIATCNKISSLPPELRRRFKRGTFFMDLPDAAEREVIWKLYEEKHNVSGKRPEDRGWTGAEIEQCCEMADELNLTLIEAAEFVVPVCKSAADDILTLRKMASGKFISASKPGTYEHTEEEATAPTGRKMRVTDEEKRFPIDLTKNPAKA